MQHFLWSVLFAVVEVRMVRIPKTHFKMAEVIRDKLIPKSQQHQQRLSFFPSFCSAIFSILVIVLRLVLVTVRGLSYLQLRYPHTALFKGWQNNWPFLVSLFKSQVNFPESKLFPLSHSPHIPLAKLQHTIFLKPINGIIAVVIKIH